MIWITDHWFRDAPSRIAPPVATPLPPPKRGLGEDKPAEVGWGACRTVPGTASDTLVYDKVGNLVNDGKGLAYKYDGLGRLREVRLTGESNRLKTAYRYNGLGMRITHAINMSAGNSDDDVTDSGDPVTYFAYDERWRVAGAWVSSANTTPSSSTPTERWIHHAAGFGGTGGSSYIDSVVLRDRDVVTSGGSASSTSDGGSDALEERIYVLQNWRADVVATVGRTGTLIEWMQYTAYGSAITNPPGNADFNGDGDVDASDTSAFFDAFTAGLLSADVNNDGSVTGDDVEAFDEIWDAGLNPEPGVCAFTAIRVGYAGYQWDGSVNIASERAYTGAMAGLYHVRHRVYDPEMGRWTRRDPIGYVDGMGLYQYVRSRVWVATDPSGLRSWPCWEGINPAQCCINSVADTIDDLYVARCEMVQSCRGWNSCESRAAKAGYKCCSDRAGIVGPWQTTCDEEAKAEHSRCVGGAPPAPPATLPVNPPPVKPNKPGPTDSFEEWLSYVCYISGCGCKDAGADENPTRDLGCAGLAECLFKGSSATAIQHMKDVCCTKYQGDPKAQLICLFAASSFVKP